MVMQIEKSSLLGTQMVLKLMLIYQLRISIILPLRHAYFTAYQIIKFLINNTQTIYLSLKKNYYLC